MKDMACDIETGLCKTTNDENIQPEIKVGEFIMDKDLELFYFTDPICSACYIFEDTLESFLNKYQHEFDYRVIMGGLVPDENSFNDPRNGIFSSKDVAKHWLEFSKHFNVPINVDMWENDPMKSSLPPSYAFKVAELEDKAKANKFLKSLRIAVFKDGLNIERKELILKLANKHGLNGKYIVDNMDTLGKKLFLEEISWMQKLGVRGFPALVIRNKDRYLSTAGIISSDTLEKFYARAKTLA
ncbi:MAG: DsbA family protein [Acholeplasmataceae bacterium]